MRSEVIKITLNNKYNGRYSFIFESLNTTLDVVNTINRKYKLEKIDKPLETFPKPFHYIIDGRKEAIAPLYIDFVDYIRAIEQEYPDRFDIVTEVLEQQSKYPVQYKMVNRKFY